MKSEQLGTSTKKREHSRRPSKPRVGGSNPSERASGSPRRSSGNRALAGKRFNRKSPSDSAGTAVLRTSSVLRGSASSRDGVLWPTCTRCGESANLQASPVGETFATCCGISARVQLAYIDARFTETRLTEDGLLTAWPISEANNAG